MEKNATSWVVLSFRSFIHSIPVSSVL